MEDSALKGIIHLVDEENEQATNDLQSGASNELNKTGFSTNPKDLNPHQESLLEGIRHDVLRVGRQTLEEMTVGSHHNNAIKGGEPSAISSERETKKDEELEEAA